MRPRIGRDPAVAFASIVIIAMSVAAGPGGPIPFLGGAAAVLEPPRLVDASMSGPVVTLLYDGPIAPFQFPTPDEIEVRVNGGEPLQVISVAADLARRSIQIRTVGGVGSLDAATLSIFQADHASFGVRLPDVAPSSLRITTPPWTLPDILRGPTAVTTGEAVYVFRGHQFVPEPGGTGLAFVHKVLRIDAASGDVRTLGIETNAAAYAWDPRPLDGCPQGCVRLLVREGEDREHDGSARYMFGRFDPATETVTIESDPIGPMPTDARIAWTGTVAYAFFAYGPSSTWKFDPATRDLTRMRGSIPEAYNFTSLQPTWDPRPSLLCPEGCAYLLGGHGSALAGPGVSGSPRDEIWRYDPRLDLIVPMRGTLPEAFNEPPMWIGSAAYQIFIPLGGGPAAGTLRISRYDPIADEAHIVGKGPAARDTTFPVWMGDHAILVGGVNGLDTSRDIVRVDVPGAGPGGAGSLHVDGTQLDGNVVKSF